MFALDLPVADVHQVEQASHGPEIAVEAELPSKGVFPFLPARCGHVALFDEAS